MMVAHGKSLILSSCCVSLVAFLLQTCVEGFSRSVAWSFSSHLQSVGNVKQTHHASSLAMSRGDFEDACRDDSSLLLDRREVFSLASATGLSLALLGGRPLAALAEGGMGSSPEHPIAVVGAGGKCGVFACKILADKGLYVRAITRTGRTVLPESSQYVSYAAGDVTKPETLKAALAGASGALFTASASKNGGDAAHVDYLGVYNTAVAAIENKVAKLGIISSGAVTRPTSIGFKITNVFGRIMDYKIAGEEAVRSAYSQPQAEGLSYTIIRPGGLSDEPSKGPSNVEVSQGDILSAEIGRQDVSEVLVAALLAGKDTDGVTLEVYGAGGETLFGQKTGPASLAKGLPDPSKFVHRAETYEGLVAGLLNDQEMRKTGVVSDYAGTNVESLESLM